ncbi:hypothetical protein EDD86DRAFT_264074 [Gorgonomyces haynaldii]|nr:hypothetical protein EDD86DRAFT_264074 [Gorgonomyces haynaldii]
MFWGSISGNPQEYTFLITGCDTGFGNISSIELASKGYIVYAGCLTQNGLKALTNLKIPNLKPVLLDVTKQVDVDRVVQTIKAEQGKLFCLINNAGIATSYFLELTSMEEYEKIFAVNVFGAVRCTKACIPLMRSFGPGSRIINISSAASFTFAPALNAYSPSKAAIRMFGDAIRTEIGVFGIKVCTIMPGFFKTAIVESVKSAEHFHERAPKEIQDIYTLDFIESAEKHFYKSISYAPKPEVCVQTIVKCALAKNPPMNKTVGWDSFLLWYLVQIVPQWIILAVVSIGFSPVSSKLQFKKK